MESEDLQEEELWAMVKPREGSTSNSKMRKKFVSVPSSPSWPSAWRFNASPRSIPIATADGRGNQDYSGAKWVARGQSSAPVDVPDWSKILKKRSKKNLWDDACDSHDNDDDDDDEVENGHHDDVDDDDDDEMVPPHEYLARRLASTQISSFSMFEGVGRTLKGRDLSRLRNAILTKTGFIE
ncbi:hypothetical protein CDL12_17786 [Handroanthus impetiginosus]|uniref:Senescence regulator S40 n=1 Tax=Handroanthus impetiginosus TaxID=429701 RepID=A0A2G9GX93_9LAMI|nr:hypothetical protein CDL12_17786 [Handroanthus impetiginosus]